MNRKLLLIPAALGLLTLSACQTRNTAGAADAPPRPGAPAGAVGPAGDQATGAITPTGDSAKAATQTAR